MLCSTCLIFPAMFLAHLGRHHQLGVSSK
jgi:hypothetical protein